jgi:2'-5' RNA ligase
MRLFVAVSPPPEAIEHLAAAVQRVSSVAGGPRWTPAERWHITLAFLGEVPESTVRSGACGAEPVGTVDKLAPVAGTPLRLSIAGAGTFPERGAPRVLWAGLAGDVAVLESLAKQARTNARRARIPLDRRPFRAHLTLGRWRPGDAADRAAARALADYRGPEFDITKCALMRSRLGPKPSYETLREWPLRT